MQHFSSKVIFLHFLWHRLVHLLCCAFFFKSATFLSIVFISGSDWSHCRMCLQDITLSCHPLLWEPRGLVRIARLNVLKLMRMYWEHRVVFNCACDTFQLETAGQNGWILSIHFRRRSVDWPSGEIPGKDAKNFKQELILKLDVQYQLFVVCVCVCVAGVRCPPAQSFGTDG